MCAGSKGQNLILKQLSVYSCAMVITCLVIDRRIQRKKNSFGVGMLCSERIKLLGTLKMKKKLLKNMPMEVLKKEMVHLPELEKNKRLELIHHFLNLVMMRKMRMSFLMVFLMILLMMLMMMNNMKKIHIKGSHES